MTPILSSRIHIPINRGVCKNTYAQDAQPTCSAYSSQGCYPTLPRMRQLLLLPSDLETSAISNQWPIEGVDITLAVIPIFLNFVALFNHFSRNFQSWSCWTFLWHRHRLRFWRAVGKTHRSTPTAYRPRRVSFSGISTLQLTGCLFFSAAGALDFAGGTCDPLDGELFVGSSCQS